MKTPYYVINKKEMDSNIDKLRKSLGRYWPNYIIGYSFKTNNLSWIIEHMKNLGLWAEVVSEDEYNLAKMLKYPIDRIIYNGPVKSEVSFREAAQSGAIVNIDSNREVDWLEQMPCTVKYRIGIRVNFDLEKCCPNETQCGVLDGRFGFCFENGEFERIVKRINHLTNVKIQGIHLHCSSKTRSLNIYKAIAETAVKIINDMEIQPTYIDIGGGFFGGVKGKPTFDDYFREVSTILQQVTKPEKTMLVIEPGMSVVGAFIDYMTSVVDVKNTLHNHFVITDGSRIHIDPLMRKTDYSFEIVNSDNDQFNERKTLLQQTVCGFTCMEADRILVMNNGKELKKNDNIIYRKVGAYTISLSPLFIDFFPAVYVKDEKTYFLVRDKWTPEHLTG